MEQKYSNTLVSGRKDGKLAYTKHLFDVPRDKSQEQINTEFQAAMLKLGTYIKAVSDHIDQMWEQHKTDIKNQKEYTDSKTKSISIDYITEIANKYLD